MQRSDDTEDVNYSDEQEALDLGVSWIELQRMGETRVRRALVRGEFGDESQTAFRLATAWIEDADAKRKDEALNVSRQALTNARKATRLSVLAIIVSLAALAIAAAKILRMVDG